MTTRTPAKPIRKLVAFWRGMTPDQRVRFAALVHSTVGSLRQIVEGRRGISSEMAVKLEKASVHMHTDVVLNRMDLNATCRRCEYARTCTAVKGDLT